MTDLMRIQGKNLVWRPRHPQRGGDPIALWRGDTRYIVVHHAGNDRWYWQGWDVNTSHRPGLLEQVKDEAMAYARMKLHEVKPRTRRGNLEARAD
jgi:hypothetical protein